MKINELKVKQGNVNIEGTVVDKQEAREWSKFGKSGKVCNATMEDDSGTITITLWNDDVDRVSIGDKIKITNGYCGEYNGDKQLSSGRMGKIEVIGKGEVKSTTEEDELEEDEIEEDFIEDESGG